MIRFHNYTIRLTDGTEEVIEHVTRQNIADGVIHLFKKNGEYADEEHLASYSLVNVKSWTKKRWP